MTIETDDKNNGNSFEYRLREVSDEEILSILKYREHFQASAFKAAIKEALKRGLIESVDELNTDKFSPMDPPAKSLFPVGTYPQQNLAIFKSLCRIFYGVGLIPVLYGAVKLASGFSTGALAALLTGILFIYLAFRLEKTLKVLFANLILAFNLPAIAFAIYFLTSKGSTVTMDLVAVTIVLIVLLYISLYARKISIKFEQNERKDI